MQYQNQNNFYYTHVVAVQTTFYRTVLNMKIVYENKLYDSTAIYACMFVCECKRACVHVHSESSGATSLGTYALTAVHCFACISERTSSISFV